MIGTVFNEIINYCGETEPNKCNILLEKHFTKQCGKTKILYLTPDYWQHHVPKQLHRMHYVYIVSYEKDLLEQLVDWLEVRHLVALNTLQTEMFFNGTICIKMRSYSI